MRAVNRNFAKGLTRKNFILGALLYWFSNHRVIFRYFSMIFENFCKILSVNTAGTSGPREPMVRLSCIYLFNRVGHGGEVAKQE